jgi:hypothetical protein
MWKVLRVLLTLSSLCASPAMAARFTVTVTGTFHTGNISSNSGDALFGLGAGTDLAGRPAQVVFTIDDSFGAQPAPLLLGAVPYHSEIKPKTPGITGLVIAQVTINGVTLQAGGRFPPEIYKPIAARSVAPNSIPTTIVQVWTSDKNSPYTAGSRALLDCNQSTNPGFVTDYRWNGAFHYPIAKPSLSCAVSINYFNKTSRGWAQASGVIWASDVVQVEEKIPAAN